MSGEPGTETEGSSRRRLLALLGAALLTLVGAGTGISNFFGSDDEGDESGVDLAVAYSVTPDEPNATPTPTPPPGGSAEGGDDATDPPEQPDATTGTDGREGDPTPTETPWYYDDPDDDPQSQATVPETATPTPNDELVATSIPPVSISDVEPGDGGTVDLSATLSGSPARLWARGDVTDTDEGGTNEVERSAGDTGEPGELQDYVQVQVWYDGDGDGDGDGDAAVYEGTLAALDSRDAWITLTEECVVPGTQSIRVRWDLPADTPNVVQTDGVSFSLGIAADTSECA